MDKLLELKKIKELLDDNIITREEFSVLKNEILGSNKPPLKDSEDLTEENVPTKIVEETEKTIHPITEIGPVEGESTFCNPTQKEDLNVEKTSIKSYEESIKKEEHNKVKFDNDLKCKKCGVKISKYLNETNKGLCIECEEKSIQIPNWAYLFLLLLIPLFWWVFKDTPTEKKLQEVEIKEVNETGIPQSSPKKEQPENTSLNITNTSNHFISNQDLISLFNVNIEDLGDSFIGYDNYNKPEFEITSKQFFNLGDRELLLTSLGIKNPNDCHGCRGRLDIGFFEFSNDEWKKINHLKNASSASYGSFPTFNEFKFFGKNKLCVEFLDGDQGTGGGFGASIIFGLNNNVLTKIATIITSETNWTSDIEREIEREYEFIDTGKEYYSLKIIEKANDKSDDIKYLNFNSNNNKFEMGESRIINDGEINNKDYNELGNYIVKVDENGRAYFHNKPEQSTQRKAYLVKGENVYVQKIENDFGYVKFTNAKGIISYGWIKLNQISKINY